MYMYSGLSKILQITFMKNKNNDYKKTLKNQQRNVILSKIISGMIKHKT